MLACSNGDGEKQEYILISDSCVGKQVILLLLELKQSADELTDQNTNQHNPSI